MVQTNASGLLFVYGEPGAHVTEDSFNSWYDSEHIPALATVPGFLTSSRHKAVDGQKPSWLALYDLTSPDVITGERIRQVLAAASDNERTIKANLAMLNRRVFSVKLDRTRAQVPGLSSTPPTASVPAKFVLAVMMKPSLEKEDEFVKFYEEEHMDCFAKTPGWLRGRLYKVVSGPDDEAGRTTAEVTTNAALTFLALHELSTIDSITGPEAQESLNTPWAKKMLEDIGTNIEQRLFEVYTNVGDGAL